MLQKCDSERDFFPYVLSMLRKISVDFSFWSASLTSWENYHLNGPGGPFLQHFLLLGMSRVGVFQCNRKYFDLSLVQQVTKSRTRSSLSPDLSKMQKKKRVWERQRPTSCQEEKSLFFYLCCKQYMTHNLTVVPPRSGKSYRTFFSSQFCFLLCMKQ